MLNSKILLRIFIPFFLFLALVIFGIFFYTTGGTRLAIVTINYLIPNIPDKKYTWVDFTDRGPTQKINGFYIDGDEESFRMWTLSGIKRFYNVPNTSMYSFKDVCAAIKYSTNTDYQITSGITVEEQLIEDFSEWQKQIKKEYFVTVSYSNRNGKFNLVDIVRSVNGKYKVIGRIEDGGCD